MATHKTDLGIGELLEEGALDSGDPPPHFAIVPDDAGEELRYYLYTEIPLTLIIRD